MTGPWTPLDLLLAVDWSAPCPIAEGHRLALEDAARRREREATVMATTAVTRRAKGNKGLGFGEAA